MSIRVLFCLCDFIFNNLILTSSQDCIKYDYGAKANKY